MERSVSPELVVRIEARPPLPADPPESAKRNNNDQLSQVLRKKWLTILRDGHFTWPSLGD